MDQETDEIVAAAHELSAAEFVARFEGLYLLIAEDPDALASSFNTDVRDYGTERQLLGSFAVMRLAKRPGNPYPDRISVGRARNCDVPLRHPSVSKLHAHFRVHEGGALTLIDTGSKNGTRVNGKSLVPDRGQPVVAGDKLDFGSLHAVMADPQTLYELL